MRFRTEIDAPRFPFSITHSNPLLLLGSCFSDEIGARLCDDGFDVLHNPLGPLFNPLSVGKCLQYACQNRNYSASDLTVGPRGFHCLDYASRFSGQDAHSIVKDINDGLDAIRAVIQRNPVLFLTYGSAYIYEYEGNPVGNCHKFPPQDFTRRRLSVEQAYGAILDSCSLALKAGIKHIILTVSPVRHLDDGLHGNTLNKAVLHLAAEQVMTQCEHVHYFPAFEILNDDLRDYRFYAADMKHPSPTAVDYIYDIFCQALMSRKTRETALECRRQALTSRHRNIL